MEHLEGRQSVLAALEARQRRFEVLLVAHGAHIQKLDEVLAAAERAGVPVKYAARADLDQMAHGHSHGGLVAVCTARPRSTFGELLAALDGRAEGRGEFSGAAGVAPLLLLIEGIDDARNLGFTLRTAEAMGADAVLVKKHLWDFEEVEVARPSSGAYERLRLVQFDSAEPLRELQKRRIRIYGCIAGVRRTIYKTRLTGGVCLCIGGEKRGLSGAVRRICDKFVTIPTVAGAASLSLTAAAATVLSEARRQRLMAEAGEMEERVEAEEVPATAEAQTSDSEPLEDPTPETEDDPD